ncbi:MAG: hypothetical protein J7L19_07305 [Dehalococcoidia bacterium]|nr:hypothetical protein [Dehalococcoidia bacterium]
MEPKIDFAWDAGVAWIEGDMMGNQLRLKITKDDTILVLPVAGDSCCRGWCHLCCIGREISKLVLSTGEGYMDCSAMQLKITMGEEL